MEKILIIDDDRKLVKNIQEYLQVDGYQIYIAFDGLMGIEKFKDVQPDIVILDLMMPILSGLDVCKELRKESSVPIIILTAKGEETDVVVGLEIGADDYLTKPFSLRELSARIRANLRRVDILKKERLSPQNELMFKNLYINLPKCEVIKNGKKLSLTATEFNLLKLLASNPGRLFSRDELLDEVRGKESTPFDRSIDFHISHLRQKIENDPKNPFFIKTIWGMGYKFEEEECSE